MLFESCVEAFRCPGTLDGGVLKGTSFPFGKIEMLDDIDSCIIDTKLSLRESLHRHLVENIIINSNLISQSPLLLSP